VSDEPNIQSAASSSPRIGDTRPAPQIGDTRPGTASVPPNTNTGGSPGQPGGQGGGNRRRRGGRGRGGLSQGNPQRQGGGARLAETPVEASAPEGAGEGGGRGKVRRRRGGERRTRAQGRYLMCVHTNQGTTHIATLEGRSMVEYTVAKGADETNQIDGNIYRGRVQNVLPGMELAFVDIGIPKNAVLYRGDVPSTDDVEGAPSGTTRIEEMIKPDRPIICQVTKNAIGAKGARLTQEVSMPGRFAVLVPNSSTIGISKRLPDGERAACARSSTTSSPSATASSFEPPPKG
jgi:ribonuclease E